MNHRERVILAINHKETDRVPRGEFWLEKGLIKKLVDKKDTITIEDEIKIYEQLGIDLRVIMMGTEIVKNKVLNDYELPIVKEINYDLLKNWKQKSNLFLMAGINGIFQSVCTSLGFETFITSIKKSTSIIGEISVKWVDFMFEQIKRTIEVGADGILIADDIAYDQGTLISPNDLRELFFPVYKKVVSAVKELNVPVFFHCDGNINSIINDLIDIGFDGLHSLEKEAGMDILKIKKESGNKICLMGNLGMPILLKDDKEEMKKEIRILIKEVGKEGGFILGSSMGILGKNIPIESLLTIQKIMTE